MLLIPSLSRLKSSYCYKGGIKNDLEIFKNTILGSSFSQQLRILKCFENSEHQPKNLIGNQSDRRRNE